jgi:hypothetical protein
MNTPPKHPNWTRLLIVTLAMLPLIVLYFAPTSWTRQIGPWAWLLLAIGNGLMWLCLAAALVALNRETSAGVDSRDD